MKTSQNRWTYLAPRALGLAFCLFTLIFAADAFTDPLPLSQRILSFGAHLLPTGLLLSLLAVSWRRPWFGVVAFSVLGLSYVVGTWDRFPWQTHAVIAGPLVLVGLLFLVEVAWQVRPRDRT